MGVQPSAFTITEITEVIATASVSMNNVTAPVDVVEVKDLADTLTPVLSSIVSDGLAENQQLLNLTITAINGEEVLGSRLRGLRGRVLQDTLSGSVGGLDV